MFASTIREGEEVVSTRTGRHYFAVGWAEAMTKVALLSKETGELYHIEPQYLRRIAGENSGDLLINIIENGIKTL